jgi:ribose/xylose/arabinose/galactoside ABC-type transport system permease subunit
MSVPMAGAFSRMSGRLVGSPIRILLLGIGVLVVLGLVLEPGRFVTPDNFSGFGIAVSVPVLIAIAAGTGLLGGVIDLSIGSMVGFSAAVFVVLMSRGLPPLTAALITVCCALAVGAVNGMVCVVFGAHPLVATIGSLSALQGLTLIVLNNESKVGFIPELYNFTNEVLLGFPVLFTLIVALGVLVGLLLTFTRYGRHVRAVGGDAIAARRAGIPVARLQFALFLMTAVFACIGGIIYVGQDGAAQTTLGAGLELHVYAPILLGGYSLTRGGVGNVLGAVLGVLTLQLLGNMLDLGGINPYWQDIATGVVVIVAVFGDGLRGGERFS